MNRLEEILKEMISEDGAICFTSHDMADRRLRYINRLAQEALEIVNNTMTLSGEEAFELAQSGELPADSNQWDHITDNGWTMAHVAADSGTLPEGFNQWSIAGFNNSTVAHRAARFGGLPADFDQWGLMDDFGWTVAHEAAHCGTSSS